MLRGLHLKAALLFRRPVVVKLNQSRADQAVATCIVQKLDL